MAYNEKLADRVREALAHIPAVEEKKMFRGVTFMVDGKMCISVGDNELMCRIDPHIRDTALQKEGCREMVMKGRTMKGYVLVNGDVLKTGKAFDYWIGMSLDFNKRAKASKRRKK